MNRPLACSILILSILLAGCTMSESSDMADNRSTNSTTDLNASENSTYQPTICDVPVSLDYQISHEGADKSWGYAVGTRNYVSGNITPRDDARGRPSISDLDGITEEDLAGKMNIEMWIGNRSRLRQPINETMTNVCEPTVYRGNQTFYCEFTTDIAASYHSLGWKMDGCGEIGSGGSGGTISPVRIANSNLFENRNLRLNLSYSHREPAEGGWKWVHYETYLENKGVGVSTAPDGLVVEFLVMDSDGEKIDNRLGPSEILRGYTGYRESSFKLRDDQNISYISAEFRRTEMPSIIFDVR